MNINEGNMGDLVRGQAEVVVTAPGPGRAPAEAGLLRLAGAEREAGGRHHGTGGLVLALHTVPVSAGSHVEAAESYKGMLVPVTHSVLGDALAQAAPEAIALIRQICTCILTLEDKTSSGTKY